VILIEEDRGIGRKICHIFTLFITNLTGKQALGDEGPTNARELGRPQLTNSRIQVRRVTLNCRMDDRASGR
jgi:hypothetical protein